MTQKKEYHQMLPDRYTFREAEPRLAQFWDETRTYAYNGYGSGPIFTIDTPPPTVSGELHIGHCYSYTQTDVLARFQRMRGKRVFYPMGFDDNGLPTERFVEKTIKQKATEMERSAFIEQALELIHQTEDRFERIWRRLSLSVDWHYRYATILPEAQRIAQRSFIQLYQAGRAYSKLAPTLWCPECQTAIAQAEVDDIAGHPLGKHERCGTPVEERHTRQWFIRILDQKERWLEAGRQIHWHPAHMRSRYEHWVENLQWDWCISRQRFLGVPFPAWTCRACGEITLATPEQLPIDPRMSSPAQHRQCGSADFEPEPDVMDTWATSSCTPLIIGRWLDDPEWFAEHAPADLRAQSHDIIRTWAFYTIVKSIYHTGQIPWRAITISGHAVSADQRKISKSKNGPEQKKLSKSKGDHEMEPLALMEQESADALRYWATTVKTGSDTHFSPEILATGRRLITKLWNASRFAERHLADFKPDEQLPNDLLSTDRWLLSRLARTITYATNELEGWEYATARSEIERFFWSDFCDNYLELAKARLYHGKGQERRAAQWTLYHTLLSTLKMLAPYLPYITEEIYQGLFREREATVSLHISAWPAFLASWISEEAEGTGMIVLEIIRQVRRYKAEHGLSVGAELESLQLRVQEKLLPELEFILVDLKSATRTKQIVLTAQGQEEETLQLEIT